MQPVYDCFKTIFQVCDIFILKSGAKLQFEIQEYQRWYTVSEESGENHKCAQYETRSLYLPTGYLALTVTL